MLAYYFTAFLTEGAYESNQASQCFMGNAFCPHYKLEDLSALWDQVWGAALSWIAHDLVVYQVSNNQDTSMINDTKAPRLIHFGIRRNPHRKITVLSLVRDEEGRKGAVCAVHFSRQKTKSFSQKVNTYPNPSCNHRLVNLVVVLHACVDCARLCIVAGFQ